MDSRMCHILDGNAEFLRVVDKVLGAVFQKIFCADGMIKLRQAGIFIQPLFQHDSQIILTAAGFQVFPKNCLTVVERHFLRVRFLAVLNARLVQCA